MSDVMLSVLPNPLMDDRIRGVPAGCVPLPLSDIGKQGWVPFNGEMSLPLISLDEAAFTNNVSLMMTYIREQGVAIAPHAKTPMSPAIAQKFTEAGAWGVTVADIRQASVMLQAGFRRLILANEIGGPNAAKRLARMVSSYPDAQIKIFVDSVVLMDALATVWAADPNLPPLGVLVELGVARGGLRTVKAANELSKAVLNRETDNFQLAGVAAYEGAAATGDTAETARRISDLIDHALIAFDEIRKCVGDDRPLIMTMGGSAYFDMVVKNLRASISADVNAVLILRSGALFFHDHGVYERGLTELDKRGGFTIGGETVSAVNGFKPALRVWAEVLSCPEPRLAICGMGLRDVASDQGLPRPLAYYRNGVRVSLQKTTKTTALNDQHGFVTLGDGCEIEVGDVIEFGISHPCTCLDRHAVIYGLDQERRVANAYLTSFG